MIKDIASTETAVENNDALYFTGDTIFMAGVGRMFECQAPIYFKSIQFFIESLLELNCQIENIFLFPAHEYSVIRNKYDS